MKKYLIAATAGIMAMSVSAADPVKFIAKTSKYADLRIDDITNPAKWGDGKTEISPGSDYIINNGYVCGFGGNVTFLGRSLTLGEIDGKSGSLHAMQEGDFDFGTLILNKGRLSHKVVTEEVNINADITLNAPAESPYEIVFTGS